MIKNATEIKENSRIEDVIEPFVKLRRAGANFIGLCPFHDEKSPSFNVNAARNTYKCFGCGKGGDAVSFLMELKNMTYPEALEYIAKDSKTNVEYETGQTRPEVLAKAKEEKDRKDVLRGVFKTVSQYYLDNSAPFEVVACEIQSKDELVDIYLGTHPSGTPRTLRPETVKNFGIFYSGEQNTIKQAGFWDEKQLVEIGILREGQYGTYDAFRNRLVFTISDNMGNPIGFGGRIMPEDEAKQANKEKKAPKYVNSPESLLYQKSHVLFGLHQSLRSIQKKGHAILVEGYADVVTLHDHGVTNAIASCGTALTEEQAKLLNRYTDEVIIMRDGDEAGLEAAKRDVEILLRAGIRPKICLLEPKPKDEKLGEIAEKIDPDAFIRQHNKKGFDYYLSTYTKDAVAWRVMLEFDPNDIYKREVAINTAGLLLSLVDSEERRELYLRELASAKLLGSVKTLLKDSVKKFADKKLKTARSLTVAQTNDIIQYGIYEKGNKYWLSYDASSGDGYEISNFVIKPIMLIVGGKSSVRMCELVNEHGHSHILDMDSDAFTSFSKFDSYIGAKGNFVFFGKPEFFIRIKRKIYDNMPSAYPINTMGLHKEGFFTWANGITHEGKFSRIDDYGIVRFNNTRYYLPAFSKLREQLKSDDVEADYEEEKYYVYTEGGADFGEWSKLMLDVYGANGMIAQMYYCAALYRDVIFSRLDSMFPHLNLFGMPGTGKNQIAGSISAMFGKQRPPIHIVNATDAAFTRRVAQIRNGIAWYDEYSNNIEHKRVEALKMFADGTGRAKATVENNRTTTTPVNSACIVSGQQQPTLDIALFTRCVSLNLNKREFGDTAEAHKKLKDIEKTGRLTAITADLQRFNQKFGEDFNLEFDQTLTNFKRRVLEHGNIMDRMIRSYNALLTTYKILKGAGMPFAFDEEALETACVNAILQQKESVYSEDEVSIFWRIIEFLIANGELKHGSDIIVDTVTSETYDLDWKGKEKNQKNYQGNKRLVYINFTKAHPLYLERHERQRKVKGLDLEALKYYLKSANGYQGMKRAKKFGVQTKWCMVFDALELPFELEDSIVVYNRQARMQDSSAPQKKEESDTVKTHQNYTDKIDLPF